MAMNENDDWVSKISEALAARRNTNDYVRQGGKGAAYKSLKKTLGRGSPDAQDEATKELQKDYNG